MSQRFDQLVRSLQAIASLTNIYLVPRHRHPSSGRCSLCFGHPSRAVAALPWNGLETDSAGIERGEGWLHLRR